MAGPTVDIESAPALVDYLRAAGHIDRLGRPANPHPRRRRVEQDGARRARRPARRGCSSRRCRSCASRSDWFSDPARIRREAEALRWLPKLAPPGTITPLVFEDPEQHLLAMQAVPQPHENWKSMLLAGRVDRDHVEQFAATARARSTASRAERRDELRRVVRRPLVLRVAPARAVLRVHRRRRCPRRRAFLHELDRRHARRRDRRSSTATTARRTSSSTTGRLVLLDHEVIHWGDPAFDLGFALTHLLSKAHHLPRAPRRVRDAARTFFWQATATTLGDVPWAADLERAWPSATRSAACSPGWRGGRRWNTSRPTPSARGSATRSSR